MLYVNVYLVDRNYGGPEEGGWWYDTGTAIRSFPVATNRRAKRLKVIVDRIMNKRNEDLLPVSSVLSTGRYAAWIEDNPGRDFPERRPLYE